MSESLAIVMIGATGAVGGQVLKTLTGLPAVHRLTLLGRRPLTDVQGPLVHQHKIDLFDPPSYQDHLSEHTVAICTLGVGQPSKTSKEHFVRIDRDAVLDFATGCRAAGVSHFELLCSVGANPQARSFYLRTKGELEDGLKALDFDRLSLFRPSMILTPTTQGVVLKIWPFLSPLLVGPLRKYRGVRIDALGRAIAHNITRPGNKVEILRWDDFGPLASASTTSP